MGEIMTKLTFLGDVMCKSQMIPAFKTLTGYDFDTIFVKMKDYFDKSDYVFANLETPISLDNSDLTVERWRFNSPYEFAESAFKAGINCVATANNHCLDRGVDGIKSTVRALDDIGIAHTGIFSEKEKPPLIININGIKFGVLSYTYGTNAFSNNVYLNDEEKYMVNMFQNQELSNPVLRFCYNHRSSLIGKIMRKLRIAQFHKPIYERIENNKRQKKNLITDIEKLKSSNVDFVIMYMHSGGQYNAEPTEYTKKLSEFLISSGVDIVVGSHEHVVHGGDFSGISDGKLITYCLGNFDGIAGVYDEPFDKMAEYSIAWNIYFDDKSKMISKTTFSVLKTIEISDKKIQTIPVYDLIMSTNDEKTKSILKSDMLKIAKIFSGIDYDDINEEYMICNN